MGQKILTGVQIGLQSVLGTVVPATSIMSGLTAAEHLLNVNNIDPTEYRGDMWASHRSVVVGRRGEITLGGYVCYEDIGYALGMAIKGAVAASGDGGTPVAYTYAYTPAGSGLDVPDLNTLEIGTNTQYYQYEGCFATDFQIDAGVDGLTTWQSNILAHDRALAAKTGSLSLRACEPLPANLWTWAMDATGGTLGATIYGGCLKKFSWKIAQFQTYKCMDGTQLWTGISEQALRATLTMTVHEDSSFISALATYLNQSRVLLRLQQLGTLIHGSSNTFKRMRIDGAYILKNVSKLGNADDMGRLTADLTFTTQLDTTAALGYGVSVVNAVAAMP